MGLTMAEFKNIILSLRNEKGFNQDQMAKALNVSKSTIAMWETGQRLPSTEKYEEIADYFNVDMDFLYGRSQIKRKHMFDDTGTEYTDSRLIDPANNNEKYYSDEAARDLAQFMFENPEYKVLFDASRKVKKEDIQFVKEMIDRVRGDDNDEGC